MSAVQLNEPVAIVGSACRFPGGANSPSALWKLLENPRDVSVEIPPDRFDTTTFYHPDGNHHGTTNVRQSYLLQENVRVFDAAFFNISPNEAESIDPQQRILLETVYEALEAGGHSIDYLKGSDTAVYAGTMTVDYVETIARDHNTMPTYFATGSSRAIISNRVSYFFDWHGPSMTIDTACSSSLIAVHQGVKALRTGESHVAVAAGTQVILNPEMYINESKLKMLSPTGRSRMWDADADGYARGEGVAVIVMKLLKDAIADGDDIECIVRETGANQDGFSNGLTVPNADIQAQLIQKTYAKAGLDPENNPRDRPQFFEAHGTGTQAGDPKEAAAIYKTFAKNIESSESPLYVGSVKTVIGHLEGAAGLAGVLKGSAMIQAGFMTPNLLFNRLNPRIAPFYKGMQILTQPTPWPTLLDGVPRRVSVNSFGFGGSNAHAILEQYQPTFATPHQNGPLFSPFLFSAASESSLVAQLQAYSAYLKTHQDINVVDLAWTLHSRRSHLGCRAAFSALTIDHLSSKIDAKLAELKNTGATIGTRSNNKAVPHLLGIFTGQGAQWPAMGAKLIRTSEFVRKRIELLEQSLATLPLNHRPTWSLVEEMLAEGDTSRISEAVMSQPLCTAVQIVLVDLLQAAGITFSAVVGHSSGEIAAAYAAGVLSDTDCIRIAYYRGLYARLAGNQNTGQKGAMLAVGTSWEDAEELVNLRAFKGRLSIAAYNSPASMTLSGDVYSVIHAKKVLDEEKKFSRILKVDTAYHSHHMLACGDPYVLALRDCGIQVNRDRPANAPAWFSSVTASTEPVDLSNELQDVYWRDNMCNPVLFSQAVQNALLSDETMNVVVEVGPHPALQGPTVQNVSPDRTSSILYTGVLKRGIDDVEAFANALGSLWTVFPRLIDFQAFEKTVTGDAYRRPQVVTGLPKYEWDHSRTYWTESRISRRMRHRKSGPHEILGMESPDSNSHDMRWLNILKQSEIPWLEGHQLQGQTVFPAAGYVAMALEASRYLAGDRPVELFELHNLVISKAIAFEEGDRGAETLVALTAAKYNQHHATAEFACYSSQVLTTGSNDDMELIASGTVKIIFGSPGLASLAGTLVDDYNMAPVDEDMFYSTLDELGYGYHGPFRTMSSMKRRLNQSSVSVKTYTPLNTDQTEYMVHPTTLDVAFQSSILAYSAPGDGRLWSISVPTSIGAIRVNPEVCKSTHPGTKVPVCSALEAESESLSSNIDIFSEDGEYGMVQIENLTIKPFAPATAADDRILFTRTELNTYQPDGTAAVQNARPSAFEVEIAIVSERISYYYLRRWKSELSDADWTMNEQQPHWAHLNAWVDEMLSQVSKGEHPTIKKEYSQDSHEEIQALISRYRGESIDVKVLQAVGENLPAAVRGETTILEHLLSDNMLDDMYKKGLGFERYNFFLARMMKQLTHRYPHSRILEIGAGTGGATKAILETIRDKFSSYTYTDLSVGFFSKAAALFKPYADKMSFKVLDIEKAPTSQGYEPQSYDIVVASNVLHATRSIQKTLEHTRQLLKPGGWLMLLEITGQSPIRYHNTVGTLAGWWLGVDDGRKFSPLMTPALWNTALRRAGFGGVDAITPEIDGVAWPYSIIASQAVNDRVNFLRRPLSAPSSAPRRIIDSMVIMGNKTLETFQLSEDLMEHIGRFCGETTILSSLPTEAEALNLAPGSTFVNLVDLDTPIFENMTASKMDGLKRMLELSKRVIWVTQCAQMDQPYHMSSIAFSRALRMEESHLSLNHIDISGLRQSNSTSKTIAEYVIRQSALDEWQAPPSVLATPIHREFDILWSKEYEVFLDSSGRLQIPRLVENDEQNARLNSLRRTLTKSVPISKNIQVIPNLANTLSDVVEQIAGRTVEDDSLISIQASSLLALNVDVDIFLFLGIGKSNTQDNLQVVLSTSNFSQVRPLTSVAVPASLKANMDTNDLLVAVASELIADALMNRVSTGSHILLHASRWDVCLASALSRRATAESIRLSFSCDSGDQQQEGSHLWLKIDAGAPNHVIRKHINMGKPTHFVDLTSGTADLGQRIAQVIPSNCTQIDASTLFRRQSSLPNHLPDPEVLLGRLKEAVSRAKQCASDLVVPLDRLRDLSHTNPTSGIQWPLEGLVEAEVRALDTRNLFSKDKSYLLVGLTGQLGQSLAHWMASNGAGCVILTSRQPEVDKTWLDSFQGSGTTVKIMAMDVLDRNSLETQIKDISMTCPPIGGVANGAMVLEDTLFSKMSTETMQKVLGPKINGSQNLDDIFHNDDLDFFVLLSSVACVLGNGGQSNYSAANGYLHALARKRRRRGLAASVIDIGRVTGIGYIEGASQVVREQLKKLRLAPISEVDFRQAFAETIQAGYPDPETDQEAIPNTTVTTGIWHVRDDEEIKGPWFSNPLFSHLVIEGAQTDFRAGTKNDKLVLPISQVLPKAANREEALVILQDALSTKLRVVLQLGNQAIDPDTHLAELGIDSLVAVEVRSWFLKELKVDIPVLKIVSGASLAELCERAFDKLTKELEPAGNGKPESQDARRSGRAVTAFAQPIPLQSSEIPTLVVRENQAVDSNSSDTSESPSGTTMITTPDSQTDKRYELTPDALKPADFLSPTIAPKSAPTSIMTRRFLKSERISLSQSRFWFLRHLLEDQTTPNVVLSCHLTGDLRIGDLEKAIRIVTTRHEALRSCFVGDVANAGEAYQKVMPNSPLRLERKTIYAVEDVPLEYKKLQSHVFDLENGDIMRLILLQLSTSEYYLLVNYHHIVMDGFSFQVFLSDLEKAYDGQSLGEPPLQYTDVSAAQRRSLENDGFSEEYKYWRAVFPADEEPPVLPLLPMARTSVRVAMKNFDTHQVGRWLAPEVLRRVKSISKAQRSTPFHLHLAVFKAMLFSFAGPDTRDLTIGIADAARNDSRSRDSIGLFLNLLPLRFRQQHNQTSAEAIAEARDTTYAALSSSSLPFDVLLSEFNIPRSSLHSPFFQAFIDYRQGSPEKQSWSNIQLAYQDIHPGRTAYDITLDVLDNPDSAYIMIRVQKSLYDVTAANLLVETYLHFLDAFTKDARLVFEEIPRFSKTQRAEAVKVGRGPDMLSDWPATLPHRIDQIAQENRGKVALMDDTGKVLTYSDMICRAEAMAEALQNAGVRAGSRVLVFQQPTVDWPCSMLAIMRIGAIYVPLDLRNPLTRLAVVAQDSEASAALVDATTAGDAPHLQISVIINVSSLAQRASTRIHNSAHPASPAAVLYTSGSTGTPKGIVVTHAGLCNEIEGYTKTWGLKAERVLQQSAMTFNHASDQMYTGLVNGGMVYVVSTEKRGDPLEVTKIIQEQAITYTKATPSEYLLWLQYGRDKLRQASSWHFAFGGGEQLTKIITDEISRLGLPNLHFFNSYGPTEISISSHKMEIPYKDEEAMLNMGRISCGYSLPNYHTYIVDEKLKPMPIGMPGEICLGGAGVSLGYLNNQSLTDHHFVLNPFANSEDIKCGWTRMYRTGDIGYLREDGTMVFQSRIAGDTQVKIRGIRVELSDIENSIVSVAAGVLKEAIVTLHKNDLLVAHVMFTAQNTGIEEKHALLDRILHQLPLPQYMIPAVAIPVERFPMSNHAKVDRKAVRDLPLPERTNFNDTAELELTETMLQLKVMWEQTLGERRKQLGMNITRSSNFFLVGGNSILVIHLQAQIRQVFNIIIPLYKLLGLNTLGDMARIIDESNSALDIDWELETRPSSIPNFLADIHTNTKSATKHKKTLLITGGTGFTAGYLLPKLVSRDDIETIHCVALRKKQRYRDPFTSSKVVYHRGDLSAPLLGLDQNTFYDLASQVDLIIHMGAVRSFFDNYHILRSSNTHPTKELIKLAAPRHVPIHFLSTHGVLPHESIDNPGSAAAHVPAADGNNGYVASKWASERLLERSAADLGIPSRIYRLVPSPSPQQNQNSKENVELLAEFSRLVDVSRKIPDMEGYSGRVDFAPAEQIALWLYEAFTNTTTVPKGTTQFYHYASPISLDAEELRVLIDAKNRQGFEVVPLLKWFGLIKAFGFGFLPTSQELTIDSVGTGQGIFTSRR